MSDPKIAIVMGSDSDLPVMQAAIDVCREFDIPFDVRVMSAHRTPGDVMDYAASAYERGLRVIIAGAGGAAHLPGVIAAYTPLPIIGVPIQGKSLDGLDSLLSIVQMPSGVPVATVAINGATNAALLAVQILAVADSALHERFVAYKAQIAEQSRARNAGLKY